MLASLPAERRGDLREVLRAHQGGDFFGGAPRILVQVISFFKSWGTPRSVSEHLHPQRECFGYFFSDFISAGPKGSRLLNFGSLCGMLSGDRKGVNRGMVRR
jgi:hypothetical protein